jgi:hypothetical protein
MLCLECGALALCVCMHIDNRMQPPLMSGPYYNFGAGHGFYAIYYSRVAGPCCNFGFLHLH